MEQEIENKLNLISDIWNHFIFEYTFCKKYVKFDEEFETNYFGDIIGYFQDTNEIISNPSSVNSHIDRFANQISLLQSIYVQQDLIEELLRLFKLKDNKGSLKTDPNYSINRDIRNELVGHPIRRLNGNGHLISSCLFGYDQSSEKLTYLKYHRNNNFEFESMEILISDIKSRHKQFVLTYFDKIINKLEKLLLKFIKEINILENLIDKKSFEEILKISEVFFETIFNSNKMYDKESLLKIYARKEEHNRYKNFIDQFYKDLRDDIKNTKNHVGELFDKKTNTEKLELKVPIFNIQFVNSDNSSYSIDKRPITYHYELGKLLVKKSISEFKFHSNCLKDKCLDNKIILQELIHMESNFYDDIEYYTAFRVIYNELN